MANVYSTVSNRVRPRITSPHYKIMKKITIYMGDGSEIKVYLTAEGKGFKIHDLGGKEEVVLEHVSVTDASAQEEAVIRKYLEKTSKK